MNDEGSIHHSVIKAGYKSNDMNNKGLEHWKQVIYDIFKEDVQVKQIFVATIHNICGSFPQHKKQLRLLRAVVDSYDEELSLASMSIKSKNSTNSQDDDSSDESDS